MKHPKLLGVVLATLVFLLFAFVAIDSGVAQLEGSPCAIYPPPAGGYTCLPTCGETDGKFLSMPGEQMASFGGEGMVLWISVPEDYETFEVGIFDGDSGKDENGNINLHEGNWDNTTTQVTYRIYTDRMKDGDQGGDIEIELGAWFGNDPNPTSGPYCTASSETMPNNGWYTLTCNNLDAARAPSGHYFYRLEVTRPVEGPGISAFKLRSTGYLSSGQADLTGANFAIVGMLATQNDISILYPDFVDLNNPGECNYDGEWDLRLHVPNEEETVELWDGDFDRGTSATDAYDTDDPNTEGKPIWAGPWAVDERAGGQGAPADDNSFALYRVEPAVWYEIIAPDGISYVNDNPSGTEEWERFVVSTDDEVDADLDAAYLGPGYYTLHIVGLDLNNTAWIHANYEIVIQKPPPVYLPDTDGDGITDCEDSCPASNLSPTVIIDACDTAVLNRLSEGGCTISDRIAICAASARNHGQFVRCVTHLTKRLKRTQVITRKHKGAIRRCAAKADIP